MEKIVSTFYNALFVLCFPPLSKYHSMTRAKWARMCLFGYEVVVQILVNCIEICVNHVAWFNLNNLLFLIWCLKEKLLQIALNLIVRKCKENDFYGVFLVTF